MLLPTYLLLIVVSCEEALTFEMSITEEDAEKAIGIMKKDKALGLFGFSLLFFQEACDFIKYDLMSSVVEFNERGVVDNRLNSTFIILFAKFFWATNIKGFYPISPIRTNYKILDNILSRRYTKVLPSIIFHNQGLFMGL